ncbi:hypothetical protein [Paenibacillus sp. 32352]|uniref:hypothetical protein n=1 Tax=Paenibacillus sp. 32352 TaxID=1969111 RepID=UPI001C4DE403|nr:hypothetical protein [Paenibacillus sp. 32352]
MDAGPKLPLSTANPIEAPLPVFVIPDIVRLKEIKYIPDSIIVMVLVVVSGVVLNEGPMVKNSIFSPTTTGFTDPTLYIDPNV